MFVLNEICLAQTTGQKTPSKSAKESVTTSQHLKSSPAFAEVLLRRTELESELESLLVSYTEEFPKVQDLRFEMSVLRKDIERLNAVKANEAGKLTAALGKLIVRKAEVETELWNLQKKFGDTHPEVQRAKRKTEIFVSAIRDILE
jgi:hypothetical protein